MPVEIKQKRKRKQTDAGRNWERGAERKWENRETDPNKVNRLREMRRDAERMSLLTVSSLSGAPSKQAWRRVIDVLVVAVEDVKSVSVLY